MEEPGTGPDMQSELNKLLSSWWHQIGDQLKEGTVLDGPKVSQLCRD